MAALNMAVPWQVDKSLVACNHHMLEQGISDVTFKLSYKGAKNTQEPVFIPALQTLLIARSPIFYAMFLGAKRARRVIDVYDVEPEAFEELLRFIYTDEVNLTDLNVLNVMYASKKYDVTNLVKRCMAYLDDHSDEESTLQLLEQGILLDNQELKNKMLNDIKADAHNVLNSEEFTKLSSHALREILQLDLNICNEMEVFEAAMRWANKKCMILKKPPEGSNLRNVLGKNIYLIRFPTMNVDEFNDQVVPRGVLTSDEGFQVLRYLTANQAQDIAFSIVPRCWCQRQCDEMKSATLRPLQTKVAPTTSFPTASTCSGKSGLPVVIKHTPIRTSPPTLTLTTSPQSVQSKTAKSTPPSVQSKTAKSTPLSVQSKTAKGIGLQCMVANKSAQSSSASVAVPIPAQMPMVARGSPNHFQSPHLRRETLCLGRFILIRGPYVSLTATVRRHEAFTRRSLLKCHLSKAIKLKGIMVHGVKLHDKVLHVTLTVSLEQYGLSLHQYSGEPTFIQNTKDIPSHFAVEMNDVHLDSGAVDLDIKMSIGCTGSQSMKQYTVPYKGSDPTRESLSDNYVTFSFHPMKPNLLIGIEYGFANAPDIGP